MGDTQTRTMPPKKSAKEAPKHPKYADMVTEAIKASKARQGTSRQAIAKYIAETYTVGDNLTSQLRMALSRGVDGGALGKESAARFKINKEVAAEKKPKRKTSTVSAASKVSKSTPKKKKAVSKTTKTPTKKPKTPTKTKKTPTKPKKTPTKPKKTVTKRPAKKTETGAKKRASAKAADSKKASAATKKA